MTLDLLAIAAHRDDTEITCGGTLLKMKDAGHTAGIVDLTQGEMGTRGTAEDRAREAEHAAAILGLDHRENMGLPDAHVIDDYDTKMKVAAIIRRLKPRTVILPYWEGRHPDHFNTGRLATEACFFSGLAKLPLAGEPHRPFKILYVAPYNAFVRPSFIVDITDQFDRKLEAIKCYKSQFMVDDGTSVFPPMAELEDRFRSYSHAMGSLIGKKYGEAFVVKEMMEIDDVVTMPVKSV